MRLYTTVQLFRQANPFPDLIDILIILGFQTHFESLLSIADSRDDTLFMRCCYYGLPAAGENFWVMVIVLKSICYPKSPF